MSVLLFYPILSFTSSFDHQIAGYLTYPWIDWSASFNSYRCLSAWFCLRVKHFEYICETKTREPPFWFSTIKANLIHWENFQLAIFATRYGCVLLDYLPVFLNCSLLDVFFLYLWRSALWMLLSEPLISHLSELFWCRTRSFHWLDV